MPLARSVSMVGSWDKFLTVSGGRSEHSTAAALRHRNSRIKATHLPLDITQRVHQFVQTASGFILCDCSELLHRKVRLTAALALVGMMRGTYVPLGKVEEAVLGFGDRCKGHSYAGGIISHGGEVASQSGSTAQVPFH